MTDNYTCHMCGQIYTKGWTDEEAKQEKLKLFGDVPKSECEIVCDDCFQKIKLISIKELKAQARKDMANVYRKIKNHSMRRLFWKHNKECEKIMTDALLYGIGFSHVDYGDVFK